MHGVNPGFFTPNELIPQLIAEEMKRLLVRKIQFWSVKNIACIYNETSY